MTTCFIADDFCVPLGDNPSRVSVKPYNPETGIVSNSQELILSPGDQDSQKFWKFSGFVVRQGLAQVRVKVLFPRHGNMGYYSSSEPFSELEPKLDDVLDKQHLLIPG